MNRFRRLFALFGLAATWAIAWIPLGLIFSALDAVLHGRSIAWSRMPELIPLLASIGAVCGFLFGVVLSVAARRRTFDQLTTLRMGAIGFLGAAVIPATIITVGGIDRIASDMLSAVGIYGILGAATSAGTFMIARRATAVGAGSDQPLIK